MARYFFRNGRFQDRHGNPMPIPERDGICTPQVMSDIDEYASPVDGRPISSRSSRREDLKRNGCVEYEPSLSPTKGKFRNERFCQKRGLEVSEEFRK